jgi:acetyl-CoA C-acetyltransferase
MSKRNGKAAIVGIGEVPTGRFPDTEAIQFAVQSAKLAIEDAGIDKDEIDCIMPTAAMFSSVFTNEMATGRMVEELGLKNVKVSCNIWSGGSSSSNSLKLASAMVEQGEVNNVLMVQAEKLATGMPSGQAGIDLFAFAGQSPEWEVPFGQNFSSLTALATMRYQYETGTTDEQMAAVCVSNRKWAELNPHAFFRKPLTVEEVMSSKMLARPLRAKMSNMLFDGGSALIVTSAKRAPDVVEKPVYVLGEGGLSTHFVFSQEPDMTRFGFAEAGRQAYEQAGLTARDIDVAEIYDSYPIYQIIGFEELGFCGRGEAGDIFLRGDTWPGGKIPCTTDGGMLSKGHIGAGGSYSLLVESVRQLRGTAGERQVPDARFAIETGTGGTYVDSHVTILGSEIP